jgi:hypothetical protein
MRTWALQRPSGVVVTGDEVLLGRARELELLGSAYAGAVKGRPFAVLIACW